MSAAADDSDRRLVEAVPDAHSTRREEGDKAIGNPGSILDRAEQRGNGRILKAGRKGAEMRWRPKSGKTARRSLCLSGWAQRLYLTVETARSGLVRPTGLRRALIPSRA